MNENHPVSPILDKATLRTRFRGSMGRIVSFTLGMAVALGGAALLGRHMSSENIFRDFGRFHMRLSPESFYQPTARQVHALALDVLDRTRINIVVGGSSVFYGVGQPKGLTIVDNLRRELGDDYRVINLAMRGGDVSGIAELTTEMLVREGFRVIYVADIAVGAEAWPIGSPPYQYFYWDARARGLLIDWPARDSAVNRPWYRDEILAAQLNSGLYFMELWNTIGYEHLFTVYSRLMPDHFWRPRRLVPDNEIDPPEELRYRNNAEELRIMSEIVRQVPSPDQWRNVRAALELAVPEPVRRSTVLAVCENSPWILDQASPQARLDRSAVREEMVAQIRMTGTMALSSCDGFDKDDYVDRVHLSIHGARGIAPRLAESIQAVSRSAGWN
jgi:hypothetical protein